MRSTPAHNFRDRSADEFSETRTNPKGMKFRALLRSKCLCGEKLAWQTHAQTRFSNAHLKEHADEYDEEREEGIDFLSRARAT